MRDCPRRSSDAPLAMVVICPLPNSSRVSPRRENLAGQDARGAEASRAGDVERCLIRTWKVPREIDRTAVRQRSGLHHRRAAQAADSDVERAGVGQRTREGQRRATLAVILTVDLDGSRVREGAGRCDRVAVADQESAEVADEARQCRIRRRAARVGDAGLSAQIERGARRDLGNLAAAEFEQCIADERDLARQHARGAEPQPRPVMSSVACSLPGKVPPRSIVPVFDSDAAFKVVSVPRAPLPMLTVPELLSAPAKVSVEPPWLD